MRVLHAPAEIAGQASVLARALRELGVEAHSLAYNQGFPQYRPDEQRPYDDQPPLPRYLGYLASTLRHLGRWDVYHFHFGRTLIPPHNLDLPLHVALGRRVVFHYHGCDVRDRAHMLATHRRATCTECDPFCIPSRQRRILASAERWADDELVSTPDLLNMRAQTFAKTAGVPVVASMHTRFEAYLEYYGLGWARPLVDAHLRRFYRRSDHVLAPGWTSYTHRLRYQTFDVTDMLREGANALGAMLGDGWYRGRLSFGGTTMAGVVTATARPPGSGTAKRSQLLARQARV